MPRDLTAGMDTAIASASGEIIHFIELAFSGGTQRVSTGTVAMPWSAQTWDALGGALTIESVTESPDLSAGDVNLVLSGVDQSILATLLTEKYLGRRVKVWLVHLTAGAIVADPALIFDGFMNGGWAVKEIRKEDGSTGTVTVTARCVGRLAQLDQRKGFQTNMTSHQAYYPADLFFEHVNTLAGRVLQWG